MCAAPPETNCQSHEAKDTATPRTLQQCGQRAPSFVCFRIMLTIRMVEESLTKSNQRGLIHAACHTYVGQEAIVSGVYANLPNEDVIYRTHRGHGHALAKGMELG